MSEKEQETITGGCKCGKKPEECCGGKGECGGNCHKEKEVKPCTDADRLRKIDPEWHGNAT